MSFHSSWDGAPGRRAIALSAAVAVLAVAGVLPTQASNPSGGTVGASASSQSYDGARIAAVPPAATRRICEDGTNCDTYTLTVDVPANYYATRDRILSIVIAWADKDDDLDLYLCKGTQSSDPQCLNGLVSSSTQSNTTTETVTLANPEPGTYRVIAAAAAGESAYTGRVNFVAPPPVPRERNTSNGFTWVSHAVSQASSFGEPSIDVDHANRVFVTAPGGPGVQMWRSFDGGFSFDHKEIASDGGGGDSEVEFLLDDTGFTADLRISDSAVSRSTDHFKSWTQQGVGIEQDRQWLAHRCGRTVYLGYHDFALEAEMINRSDDAGKTWSEVPVLISPRGGAPGAQDLQIDADQQGNTFSGPVVVDQKTGDVYIVFAISSAQGNLTTGTPPYGEPEQIIVGSSHDGGKTFALSYVRKGGPGSLAGNIFPWITIDRAGVVYVSWTGRDEEGDPINVFLSHSTDHGKTWSSPARVNADATGHSHVYSTISAGAPGVVDVAWYTGSTEDPSSSDNDWYVDFAQVHDAQTNDPAVTTSRVFSKSIHHGDICLQGILCIAGGDRSLLDFFQVQVGPDGAANIAFANNRSPDNVQRVWYARQAAGPSAGNGLHDTDYCVKKTSPGAQPSPKVLGTSFGKSLPKTGVPVSIMLGALLIAAAVSVWRALSRADVRNLDPGIRSRARR